MKKHNACYWLNKLAEELRANREHWVERLAELEASTDENKEPHIKYTRISIAEADEKLTALDIAGDSLTKR